MNSVSAVDPVRTIATIVNVIVIVATYGNKVSALEFDSVPINTFTVRASYSDPVLILKIIKQIFIKVLARNPTALYVGTLFF